MACTLFLFREVCYNERKGVTFNTVTDLTVINQASIAVWSIKSSLISPTFSSVISRMSVQDRGFLKVSSFLVPFVNKFPRNTELYKLMTSNVKC